MVSCLETVISRLPLRQRSLSISSFSRLALRSVCLLYTSWVPGTFAIKALTALVGGWLYHHMVKREHMSTPVRVALCGIPAELVMVVGYYVYETGMELLMGSTVEAAATAVLAGVPFNAVQGLAGDVYKRQMRGQERLGRMNESVDCGSSERLVGQGLEQIRNQANLVRDDVVRNQTELGLAACLLYTSRCV